MDGRSAKRLITFHDNGTFLFSFCCCCCFFCCFFFFFFVLFVCLFVFFFFFFFMFLDRKTVFTYGPQREKTYKRPMKTQIGLRIREA